MSVHKVIEVLAQSSKGWEDAAQAAVAQASTNLRNVESVYIKEMEAKVENGSITQYRINAKITFAIEGSEDQ
jgi:flavin-binding protein dodecin